MLCLSVIVFGALMENRVYLKAGDKVVAGDGEHTWDGNRFHLNEDGDLRFIKDGVSYEIYYAFDVNEDDPNFGKPYYRASEGKK